MTTPPPAPGDADDYEHDHRENPQSGILRATIFGASDGLVSNLGVVIGVAAATSGTAPVIIAGVVALVAGAFSMAAGEYVSMRTQREVLERELSVEADHLASHPTEEQAHLALLLAEHGLSAEIAAQVAADVHADEALPLEFHARFELGIDPGALGSPFGAAASSFVAFVLGAAVPLLPFLVTEHGEVAAVLLSILGLGLLGGGATHFSGQRWWLGAGRQVLIGAMAAAVSFGLGSFVGVVV